MILTTNNLRTADGTESTHGIFECNVCNAVKYHDEGLFMSCPVSPGHRVSTGRGVDPIFATVDRLKALRGTFVFKAFEFMGGEHVTLTAHFRSFFISSHSKIAGQNSTNWTVR